MWEAWGSDSDVGWGAWSVETGWTQTWITTTLALRQLNTTLWELATAPSFAKPFGEEINAWAPTMFWAPTPQAAPCLNATVPSSRSGNITVTVSSTLGPLCSRGGVPVHVTFSGALCEPAPSLKLIWNSMVTLDPAAGEHGGCSWSRAKDPLDIPGYLGSCGISPTHLPLPARLCS